MSLAGALGGGGAAGGGAAGGGSAGPPNSADWPAASSSAALGLASALSSSHGGSSPKMSPESPMRMKLGAQPRNVMATMVWKLRSRATRCHPLWLLPSGPDQVGGRERPPDSRAGIWRRGRRNATSAEVVGVSLQLEPPRRRVVDHGFDPILLGVCDRGLLRGEAQLELLAGVAA